MLASDYGKIRQLVKNLFLSIFPLLLFTPFPVSPKGEKPFDVGLSFSRGGRSGKGVKTDILTFY